MSQETILNEIRQERKYQDQKWSGSSFDDTHSEADWLQWLNEYANGTGRAAGRAFRERMVKTAALAVAAIEAMDRKAYGRQWLEPGEVLDVGRL